MKHPFEVRERAEEIERASLSTWATLASETKGRDRYEDPDPLRTAFQLDRDRLLATDAFARLAGKTHAFVPEVVGTGWRSRLSHTVAAVSLTRAIARGLRLNEDLAEAIAIGQALGAPPFGRAGCEALGEALGHPFELSAQSLRVVEESEPRLNLTWEVRDGILHQDLERPAATREGMAAALARRLAEPLFDLRASQRAGLVRLDDLPPSVRTVLGTDHEQRVSTAITDVVVASADGPEVRLGPETAEALRALEAFLDESVHGRRGAQEEHDRALHCLRSLAIYAHANPPGGSEDITAVVDWLCAATDGELADAFTATFRPSGTAEA